MGDISHTIGTRRGGGDDIQAQSECQLNDSWSLFASGQTTLLPLFQFRGEWSVAHWRGLRRKQKHKRGYGALGSGIPHLWGTN